MKNIRNSQGVLIKTICPTDTFQTQIWNRRNCEGLNMNLARLDSPINDAQIMAFVSVRYAAYFFGYLTYDGTLGNNWCRCLSNQKTLVANNYTQFQCPCSNAVWALCEFKTPRCKNISGISKKSKLILKHF